jgi:hypothetical protein
MRLFNQTPVAARLDTSDLGDGSYRMGLLTAKATFRFDLAGGVTLDTQEPLPLFVKDEPAAGGLLPADLEPRRNPSFEIILLGHAYAPRRQPVETLLAALSVNAVRRELRVSGDRVWTHDARGAPVSTRPQPFTRMPLGYEHAFGGTAIARIDRHSEMPVFHPLNPHGRGFDAELMARQLGQLLRAPEGFPIVPGYARTLPNVESPTARVARWEDSPEPASWATLPRDVPLHVARRAQEMAAEASIEDLVAEAIKDAGPFPDVDIALYRAHPDWVIPIPASAPLIRMENLVEEKADVRFRVPDERVVADYIIEGRNGSRPLTPQMLVLLPDERRFYLLYRMAFTFAHVPGDERAMRLRLDAGWYSGGKT